MYIEPFKTEQFYAQYEFNTPHLLSVSDCETITIKNLLELAGASPIELENLALGYTESQGNPKLRAAIAAIYENATPEDVVVLTSPVEGIYLAMRTLLEPQDEAVVLVPAYDSLKNMANHICAKTRLWSLKPDKKR